jgi:tetratricopeptide (TPR) repeat protein
MRRLQNLGLLFGLSCAMWAQQNGAPAAPPSSSSSEKSDSTKQQAPNLAPPRSDRVRAYALGSDLGQSSSKDTQLDLSAPDDDDKTHPKSSAAVAEADAGTSGGNSGISEFHVWDPHKAAKSIEVGDFYFKRKNYKAAEERYREALGYKENDAVATIRLAVCLEKLGLPDDARQEYESYLKIIPHGPESEQAQKAINRLKTQAGAKGP